MNAYMLSWKIMRQGYYWTTMEANFTLAILYMGNIYYWEDSPTTSNGHEFILVAINYFTK